MSLPRAFLNLSERVSSMILLLTSRRIMASLKMSTSSEIGREGEDNRVQSLGKGDWSAAQLANGQFSNWSTHLVGSSEWAGKMLTHHRDSRVGRINGRWPRTKKKKYKLHMYRWGLCGICNRRIIPRRSQPARWTQWSGMVIMTTVFFIQNITKNLGLTHTFPKHNATYIPRRRFNAW